MAALNKTKRVIIETPYAGCKETNTLYAQYCMLDSLLNYNEAPFLSHLLYTQVLDDNIPEERKLGIEAGFVWGEIADYVVVYTDLGLSSGMQQGINQATKNCKILEIRELPPNLKEKFNKEIKEKGL